MDFGGERFGVFGPRNPWTPTHITISISMNIASQQEVIASLRAQTKQSGKIRMDAFMTLVDILNNGPEDAMTQNLTRVLNEHMSMQRQRPLRFQDDKLLSFDGKQQLSQIPVKLTGASTCTSADHALVVGGYQQGSRATKSHLYDRIERKWIALPPPPPGSLLWLSRRHSQSNCVSVHG